MSIDVLFDSLEFGPAPESRTVADKWLQSHKHRFGHFVDGRFGKLDDEQGFESTNPATGAVLATLAQGTRKDVDDAVTVAREAFPNWRDAGGPARARHLYAIARAIQKHSRLFAVVETLDNGKPIRESRDIDIPLAARHFYYHAGIAQLVDSSFAEHEPVGVCGQIIPWNFPLLMLAWKLAPALATGNTVVLKPAEFTSLSALLFAEIVADIGLPNGVVNIVTGDGATGEHLVRHEGVDKIAFTGSTEVGRRIRQLTAGSGKSLTLELGGKSPYIVFDDADLDSAVEGLVDAIWFNQGQVCCAGSRLLVQESVAGEMHDRIRRRMDKLRIGDPMDKSIDLGAIVHPVQLRRISELVERGLSEGGHMYQRSTSMPADGCYYPPSLIAGVSPSSILMQEEIFGPVLVSTTFRTPAEAVELANNTRYGLAASVWSENINLALDVAPKLACGVVWINSTNLFDAAAGFGGRRESGFGREGGWEGVTAYLKLKGSGVPRERAKGRQPPSAATPRYGLSTIDRTPKLLIGGRQTRPDSGYSIVVRDPLGNRLSEVGRGNRKDIRNAVECASNASEWRRTSASLRAQILYYIAENLNARAREFTETIVNQTGVSETDAGREVEASMDRLFHYAAWADKFDGHVHGVPIRGVAMAMKEPVGIVGVFCPDEFPLLGLVSTLAPLVAMGNTCVLVPSMAAPLTATDLYQVLQTSDVPPGVVNIVTGYRRELVETVAGHDNIEAIWYFGSPRHIQKVEYASAGNLKRTWAVAGNKIDWLSPSRGQGREFLRNATEIKNIWIPYGEV
ncbi:MAG: aldehyde dehydrogenase family protein [Rhodobacteraceae bacterium]|nr:aldehyde dehydrogenase family protein [Paracoccaceae bacterium]